MLRLMKYLKPYLLLILIAVGLLFVQANSDLALPDYMSRIVNNGIQQNGITDTLPTAIRQSEMNKLVIFLNADEKAIVLADYYLVDTNSISYPLHVKQYPILASEPIYILKTIDQAEIEKLGPVVEKGLVIVSFIQQAAAAPTSAAAMGQGLGFDLSKLPAGADIFSLLARLPEAQLTTITSSINQKFSTLGNSMVKQMAVSAVKAEYRRWAWIPPRCRPTIFCTTGIIMLLLTLLSVACTDRGRFPFCQHRRRAGARSAPECVQESGKFLQCRIRSILHRFADHPLHQRCHPDPDGGPHDDAHGLLCAHHRHRRHHPRHRQKHHPCGGSSRWQWSCCWD